MPKEEGAKLLPNEEGNFEYTSDEAREAFTRCKEDYSKDNETAAVKAVKVWLEHFSKCTSNDPDICAKEGNTILTVASENGYLKVVQELLTAFHAPGRTHLTLEGWKPLKMERDSHWKEKKDICWNENWDRCTACYDMITMYAYIGEEFADKETLAKVLAALDALGCQSMEDLRDTWDDVRNGLQKKGKTEKGMAHPLIYRLSEARYNYDSWDKHVQLKDEDTQPMKFIPGVVVLITTVLIPGIVFAMYDIVHYEDHWRDCYTWLYLIAITQTMITFVAAPHLGWGMIMESSRGKDLGETLKGSMNQQAIVSILLFRTTMSKLRVGSFSAAGPDYGSGELADNAGSVLGQWCAVSPACYTIC